MNLRQRFERYWYYCCKVMGYIYDPIEMYPLTGKRIAKKIKSAKKHLKRWKI